MIKIIFFDMEHTLFDGNGWVTIAKALGEECSKEELISHKKWKEGGYKDYREWVDESIKLYIRHGLNKKIFENTLNSVPYFDGVKETFTKLHKKGYKVCVISGGFMFQAKKAMKDLGIPEAYTACELFFDEEGNIKNWKTTLCDYENKTRIMRKVLEREDISVGEAAFIGDGKNDVAIAKTAGLSIAFNGKEELRAVSTYAVDTPNFREILKFL